MKTSFFLLAVLAVLFAGPALRADDASDKAEVRAIEKACAAALLKGDFAALGEIFAPEWAIVDPAGQVSTREQIFQMLKGGDLKFTSYELGEMDIRLYGNTAVVIGHGHPQGEWHGERFEEDEVFSDTFVRVDGKWRCVLTHDSATPEPAK